MQFHYDEYVTHDPRIQPAQGSGIDRSSELPESVDVLIVGTGPAGMLLAAQMTKFPDISTRIIEKNPGRLERGRADGVQQRSVETFQAFGFASRIIEEAWRETVTHFYHPDPKNPANIIHTLTTPDDPHGMSEFPHLIVNQARILDELACFAKNGPARIQPDYGYEFASLTIEDEQNEYPISVTLRHVTGHEEGKELNIRAKYVVGADGAHSKVRESIGCKLEGNSAKHAWGVIDVIAETDFPTWRAKSFIQSERNGTIMTIPREGGYMCRMYIDMGAVTDDNKIALRSTTLEQVIDKANAIMHPYVLNSREVYWHSIYEVGHRIANSFDNMGGSILTTSPRVMILGDACHTHSAKAGQGMNVSMQDAFNLGWKLGYALLGLSPVSLLSTYAAERRVIAKDLIDFDREFSTLLSKSVDDIQDPHELEKYYTETAEFPAGFRTQYTHSILTGDGRYQRLAKGYPIGKRFKSAMVNRLCDANPVHIGHLAEADGRWRIYVFADSSPTDDETSATSTFAQWLDKNQLSPVGAFKNYKNWFDIKVIYQQKVDEMSIPQVPQAFLPRVGKYALVNYENVFATLDDDNIFEQRSIDRKGAVVIVRPDQYVANIFPLTATAEIEKFLSAIFK